MKNKKGFKTISFKAQNIDEEKNTVEGLASVFGNIDDGGDVIYAGAFTETIINDFDRIKILALHNDEWLPIGKPLALEETPDGLYMKAKISETSMGKDILILLRDGVLNEFSIGYEIIEDEETPDGIRHLYKLKLFEISVVTWAMNEKAKVTGVKSKEKNFGSNHVYKIGDRRRKSKNKIKIV